MKKLIAVILHYIKKIEVILIVLIAAVIVAVITGQVFMRYFLNRPLNWPEELATLLLIYLSFLASDVVYKEKGHISVDYFINKMPYVVRKTITIFIYFCIIIFLIYLIPVTLTLVKMQFRTITSAVVVVPKSIYTLPVLLVFPSMLLSTIYFLIEEIEEFVKKRI